MKYYLTSAVFVLLLILSGCSPEITSEDGTVIYSSDAELIDGEFLPDSSGQSFFKGASLQSQDYSHSGNSSIKLDSTQKYGFNLVIEDPKEGELYQASVWQKTGALDGTLICSVEGANNRVTRTWVDHYQKSEWFKHSMSIIVGKGVEKLSFYVFSGGKEAYFDDIVVKRFPKIPEFDTSQGEEVNRLDLYIPEDSKSKLEGYVEDALSASIIAGKNKKYVDAFILTANDSIPIEMRLKGDWTDHLTSGKISYRIKVRGNHSFLGLKTFSIQHPSTRNYMHEWFMHGLCDREGLLSTKYEMTLVNINGVNKGTYALEEHFDKQLLESRDRREGPILKLDESGLWGVSYAAGQTGSNKSFPYYRASFESVFKKNRTLKNKNLKNQMIEGFKLLELFKNHSESVEEIFDLENIAKHYALLELGNVEHEYAWHNRRFYFNPVTQKLELIGYDMLPGESYTNSTSLYIYNKVTSRGGNEELQLTRMTLKNKVFKKHYLDYLTLFSDTTYLNQVFSEMDSSIAKNEKLLAVEMEDYQFDKDFYLKRAKLIREQLPMLDSAWQVFLEQDFTIDDFIVESHFTPNTDTFYIEEISVNAYRSKIDSASYLLELENYHLNDVSIIGYKIKGDTLIEFDEPVLMNAFSNRKQIISAKINVDRKPKEIVFEIGNHPGKRYSKKVMKWAKPKGGTARMGIQEKFKENSPYYTISGSVLTFKQGDYKLNELIYIPSTYEVKIKHGTSIDLVNGGGIIINNTFNASGTEFAPINIYSSDGKNHGLTVLQGDSVNLSYVNFDSLNTLHYQKWNLTGAVTIYESETKITNCSITNNTCEDGLNIIRSNFMIESLFVSGTYSDGFDADFCTGEIKNSRFENTGNDCIDFSGSVVNIDHIDIINSGDKGISGGERSQLIISDIKIDGAITGVAAKDDTKITGDHVSVVNAEFGLAAFQKKAEYAKASIQLTNVDYSNLDQYGLVDLGSSVVINDKFYYGGMVIDIDELYSRFEKK